ncbi:MAG TPA: hypothetical protein VHX92_01455 [Rhizomicrobium sp.]|jgi:hypothetical protein|nr:hypothetical protein [Rhizomicrobium sp.]
MKKIHAIALAAASAALFSLGNEVAVAQTVSGGDPYQQGYAAGASAKERNSFNAFDSGYRSAEANQSNAVGTEAYNDGYQAGIAQANRDKQEAYNTGYQDRADWDRSVTTARAYENGYDAGAYQQARREAEFP